MGHENTVLPRVPSAGSTPGDPHVQEVGVFTGIVEELGRIERFDGGRLAIRASRVLEDVTIGDSIAVNGCCLTVVAHHGEVWEADLSPETVRRTAFAGLGPGDPVNLERAVRADQRMGGHLVQGHVDAVGEIVAEVPDLRVRIPETLERYLVEKGSVTVDGVSLTIVDVTDATFSVAVIPHTGEVTNLGTRRVGDRVNLEVDVIAKYVERLVTPYRSGVDQLSGA
jgi:riboflavin synthase